MRDSHTWEFCRAAHESLLFDCCKGGMRPVERSSKRDIAWVNSPKSSSVTLVIFGHLVSCKRAGFPCRALSGRIKVHEAVAVKWMMAAKMLALSVRLWLARHDVFNNVCRTDFLQKLIEDHNQPLYVQMHDGMKATQLDQDIQCWIYEVKASGIHVYDMQIMEWYHPTTLLHMGNRYKAWPKGAILVQWAR